MRARSKFVDGIARHHSSRYAISAAVCVALNNIVLIAGDWLGFGYIFLVVVASFVSGSIGYGLHTWYTFRRPARWSSYFRFIGGTALALPFALGLIAVLVSILHLPMWISAPLATAIMLLYNYLNARLAIVRRLGLQ